ncbi:hypothetical protein K474DRAFT_1489269 [Panus rudis PR-1116 ss-1]|nr:hypothetical protein K474DRAFT_1489269 [Panus rudis PR-1116 ss-1]
MFPPPIALHPPLLTITGFASLFSLSHQALLSSYLQPCPPYESYLPNTAESSFKYTLQSSIVNSVPLLSVSDPTQHTIQHTLYEQYSLSLGPSPHAFCVQYARLEGCN